MQDILSQHYEWLRALHIISVIAWMAGLLYLPRLFVYHADAQAGSDQSETFKMMERRLYKFIMNPAMAASWLFGGLMLWGNPGLFSEGWMHVKLTAVIMLTGVHHVFLKWLKAFAGDQNQKSQNYYRWANEIPTVLMIVIVIMAVVQPF